MTADKKLNAIRGKAIEILERYERAKYGQEKRIAPLKAKTLLTADEAETLKSREHYLMSLRNESQGVQDAIVEMGILGDREAVTIVTAAYKKVRKEEPA